MWESFIARGSITLLGGLPKVGKSTLAFGMLEAVRSGTRSFLGREAASSSVVLLTGEPATTALIKLGDSDNVHVLVREHAWPRPTWPELVEIAAQKCQRTDAGLLVVDALSFWAQFEGDAENDAGTATRPFEPSQQAAAADLAVLVLAHQRKSGGEGGTAFRGSGAITANAEMLLELERVEGASARHWLNPGG